MTVRSFMEGCGTMSPTTTEPRWRRLPRERPGQILEAALRVFGEQGFRSTRLEDVAQRAGVSKGTIYLYFSSKDELFTEMVRHALGRILEGEVDSAAAGSAREELTARLRAFWIHLRSPEFEILHRLIQSEVRHFPELTRSYARSVADRVTSLLAGAVRRGIASGEFRDQDAAAAARIMLALLVKHAVWCARPEQWPRLRPEDADRVFEQLMDFTLASLRPDTPAAEARHA